MPVLKRKHDSVFASVRVRRQGDLRHTFHQINCDVTLPLLEQLHDLCRTLSEDPSAWDFTLNGHAIAVAFKVGLVGGQTVRMDPKPPTLSALVATLAGTRQRFSDTSLKDYIDADAVKEARREQLDAIAARDLAVLRCERADLACERAVDRSKASALALELATKANDLAFTALYTLKQTLGLN
jgi:hypothetical protein